MTPTCVLQTVDFVGIYRNLQSLTAAVRVSTASQSRTHRNSAALVWFFCSLGYAAHSLLESDRAALINLAQL